MIASMLLAVALAAPAPVQSASAQLGVSLRIVERCDPAVAEAAECTPADYDRWLRAHPSSRKAVVENDQRILQIEF